MSADNECPICIEKYNLDNNARVTCEYCPMEACRSCYDRYFLENTTFKCMDTNCGRSWTYKYILSKFTKSFVMTHIRPHIENVLFEKERQTFPEAIEKMARLETIKQDFQYIYSILKTIVTNNKKNKKQYKSERLDRELYKEVHSISNLLFEKINKINFHETITNINHFFMYIDDNTRQIYDIISSSDIILSGIISSYNLEYNKKLNEEDINILFVNIYDIIYVENNGNKKTIKCHTPSCNGSLDDNWHCIMCKKTTCSSCLEERTKDHKCNPDTVKTVNLLKTDTKPCPKCKANIYKIDGCDQMWCVKCRTAFSWKTGAIETKIHNPHYYEWRRLNMNAITNCEREINDDDIKILDNCCDCNVKYGYHPAECINKYSRFTNRLYYVMWLRAYELSKYDVRNTNNIPYRFIMKMNYLNKKINEKEYKKMLENEEFNKNKSIEIYDLIQMWISSQNDILLRVIDSIKYDNNINTYDNINIYDSYDEELNIFNQHIKNDIKSIETRYNTTLFLDKYLK